MFKSALETYLEMEGTLESPRFEDGINSQPWKQGEKLMQLILNVRMDFNSFGYQSLC